MNEITEKAIESLDEVLKCLFATLLNRYYTTFPTDPKDINRHKAGIVLNELVVEDLREDQIKFRRANAEFVDCEKREVMMLKEVRKGVLSFLVARGASIVRGDIQMQINGSMRLEKSNQRYQFLLL